jgi:hypothetical protein
MRTRASTQHPASSRESRIGTRASSSLTGGGAVDGSLAPDVLQEVREDTSGVSESHDQSQQKADKAGDKKAEVWKTKSDEVSLLLNLFVHRLTQFRHWKQPARPEIRESSKAL